MNARVNTNNLFAKIDIPQVGGMNRRRGNLYTKIRRKEKSNGSTYSNCVAFI